MRLFTINLMLVASLIAAASASGGCRGEHEPVPDDFQTPQGDEIRLRCPSPLPRETPVRQQASVSTALSSMLVCDLGILEDNDPDCFFSQKEGSSTPNDYISTDSFFATAKELTQLGRECGTEGTVHGVAGWTMDVGLHLYRSTKGAGEAFARQLRFLEGIPLPLVESSRPDMYAALGDEMRLLGGPQVYTYEVTRRSTRMCTSC